MTAMTASMYEVSPLAVRGGKNSFVVLCRTVVRAMARPI